MNLFRGSVPFVLNRLESMKSTSLRSDVAQAEYILHAGHQLLVPELAVLVVKNQFRSIGLFQLIKWLQLTGSKYLVRCRSQHVRGDASRFQPNDS